MIRVVVVGAVLFGGAALVVSGCGNRKGLGFGQPDAREQTSASSDAGGSPPADAGAPPPVDAGPSRPIDAGVDLGIPTPGLTYPCGPAGVTCDCGLDGYFPSPLDASGQPQTVRMPDPATTIPYSTDSQFDALAVGWWIRTAGMSETACDQYGIEITSDHRLIPIVRASDGVLRSVDAVAHAFTIMGPRLILDDGLVTNAPVFFEGGRTMYFLFAPWPANYVHAPIP